MNEIWKSVVGYEGIYKVSNFGRVKSLDHEVLANDHGATKIVKGRVKKLVPLGMYGHLGVQLWRDNKQKFCRVHRLVLETFVGPCPKGMECCHNDGNASNNKLSNLRWDTKSSNQMDRARHGTSNRGERCGSAKLTEFQVRAIRADTRMQKDIAHDYGVARSVISRIKSGVRWGHLS